MDHKWALFRIQFYFSNFFVVQTRLYNYVKCVVLIQTADFKCTEMIVFTSQRANREKKSTNEKEKA